MVLLFETLRLPSNPDGTFSDSFDTFTLVWTPDSISTYVDDVLRTVYYYDSNQGGSLWDLGTFPAVYNNQTAIENPWKNGGKNAPFDQEFYLILNVAVCDADILPAIVLVVTEPVVPLMHALDIRGDMFRDLWRLGSSLLAYV
ncbi:hypothetical protein HK104_004030 [Borealophlyctis nickersoniae]|nr:hypothetical protein HK104_004030 [Borealophlyctis nickersoniae]